MGSCNTYSIPAKTAALVPECAVEDLPSAELKYRFLPFALKDLPLGRTLWWWYSEYILKCSPVFFFFLFWVVALIFSVCNIFSVFVPALTLDVTNISPWTTASVASSGWEPKQMHDIFIIIIIIIICWPWWSHGYHTRHWIRGLQVQTRLGSMDFFRV